MRARLHPVRRPQAQFLRAAPARQDMRDELALRALGREVERDSAHAGRSLH